MHSLPTPSIKRLRWSILLLLPVVLVHQCTCGPISVMYERVEQIDGFNFGDARNMRIRKYNRTVTVLNGTFDLLHDIDDDYSFTIELAYSTLGNNQFIRSPFRVPLQKMCHFLNTTYRDYREFYRNMTNFPEAGVCPVRAEQFYIKNKVLDANIFNDYFQAGLWKITLFLYEKSSLEVAVLVVELLFRVSREGLFDR
uniref:Uncharacterized protein n=1 Tax=Anopheles epiroticus TaxID=199890 RepID=A0A182P805_9DIPT